MDALNILRASVEIHVLSLNTPTLREVVSFHSNYAPWHLSTCTSYLVFKGIYDVLNGFLIRVSMTTNFQSQEGQWRKKWEESEKIISWYNFSKHLLLSLQFFIGSIAKSMSLWSSFKDICYVVLSWLFLDCKGWQESTPIPYSSRRIDEYFISTIFELASPLFINFQQDYIDGVELQWFSRQMHS